MKYYRFTAFWSFILTLLAIANASAGGIDLTMIHGARQVGMGGSQITLATDGYAPFYNPAAMSGAGQGGFAFGLSNLFLDYNAPIGVTATQTDSAVTYAPLFYAGGVYRLNDYLHFGLGVFPTALQGGSFRNVNYGGGSGILADREASARLMRIEFSPSLSVRPVSYLSIGASYRAGYTRYEKAGGILTQIHFDTTMSGWSGHGAKFGVMIHKVNGLSAALTYRLEETVKLSGHSDVSIDALGDRVAFPATQKVKLPAQLQVGLSYDWIPERFTTAISYEYTWNDVIKNDSMTLTGFGNATGQASDIISTPVNYKNGHAIHVGAEYVFRLSGERNLRTQAGFAWDKATTRKKFPNPVIPPAADYYGYSLGLTYENGPRSVGFAMNYGQYRSRSTTVDAALTGIALPGEYSLTAFMAVMDYQWRF